MRSDVVHPSVCGAPTGEAVGRMAGPVLTCVAYHHFTAEPCAATRHLGVTTPPELFRRHLDYFQHNFDVIGLDALLSGDLPRRPLLITIDDAYRSVLDVAAPMLKERRLPAVLFTNPRVVTGPIIPLDNLFSLAVERHGLANLPTLTGIGGYSTFVELIMGPVAHLQPRQREIVRHDLLARLATPAEKLYRLLDLFLTPIQLARLPDFGIEIANHTASHVHLRGVAPADLEVEIASAKDELESVTGRTVRAFSFPYGNERDATPTALGVLRRTGHRANFLVHARSNWQRPSPDLWYRTSLSTDPVAKLGLRLGVLPALRTLKLATKTLISGR